MADILPPIPIDAQFGSSNWTDWYKKVRDAINNATNIPWTNITSTPTTIGGYGITDAVSVVSNQLKVTATLSNNAGASVATLGTSPVVGNPTKWIAFNDNGTVRYMPLW